MRLLRSRAEEGSVYGQNRLGEMLYDDGRGDPKDYDEAAKWFRKAAAQ